jgi:hypothetical protein
MILLDLVERYGITTTLGGAAQAKSQSGYFLARA